MDPAAWGVATSYEDYAGNRHEVPAATIDAVLEAMGATDDGPPPVRAAASDPRPTCPLPRGRRWGWSVQLYAVRSRRSWGIGDLRDLRTLARWSRARGASFLLLNPLHAALPEPDLQQASPYSPSSRCARNPLYVAVEAGDAAQRVTAFERNAAARVDRGAVLAAKLDVLEEEFARFEGDADFDRFLAETNPAMHGYAVFCTIHEEQRRPWQQWPSPLRHPSSPTIAAFAAAHAARVRFHEWVQWRLDRQLRDAGSEIALVQDLAVGVDPSGADAWQWQDAVADGVRVGAPPDEFNQAGQDWGIAPFDPWALRAGGFEPFRRTLRTALRHAGGVRIDHVMGLFRLWWIPEGMDPTQGTYVHYPAADLLDIVATEARRAGAWVVGEDLGTVEEEVREALAARNVLSYRLLWFETDRPSTYPRRSLAAVTTHDLPTVAGLWTGTDLERQRTLGVEPNIESTRQIRARLAACGNLDDDAPVEEAVVAAHRLLADAESVAVVATLEDALAVAPRPNMPGTTHEDNWSVPLPIPLEDVMTHPLVLQVADVLSKHA